MSERFDFIPFEIDSQTSMGNRMSEWNERFWYEIVSMVFWTQKK